MRNSQLMAKYTERSANMKATGIVFFDKSGSCVCLLNGNVVDWSN